MKRLLIRAEDKNPWEKRAPITPIDLKSLIEQTGAVAGVEKSEKRFFTEVEYRDAGATIYDSMNNGDIIFGVKEVPISKLLDGKVYLFFSHTIKGQKENMPMLQRIIDSKSTLIDYEKITDASGRRTVYFGNYAGDAGAINILWLMGEYWLHKGIRTPFMNCKQALNYHSVEDAKSQMRRVGEVIKSDGLPDQLHPIVIGVMGYGNVSKGAQSIFNCLPVEYINPGDLINISDKAAKNKIYVTVFKEKDIVSRKDEGEFNLQEYYSNPDRYQSQFDQYLPYITILVNATYWDNRYPKFVTWKGLKKLYQSNPIAKLQGIADITCDVNGSIECNVKTTDSGMPAYLCNPENQVITDGHKGDGIVLLAVDNLPAELPNDASSFFSKQLKPYIKGILESNYVTNLESSGLPEDIKSAVIVYNGKLTDSYRYLEKYL